MLDEKVVVEYHIFNVLWFCEAAVSN